MKIGDVVRVKPEQCAGNSLYERMYELEGRVARIKTIAPSNETKWTIYVLEDSLIPPSWDIIEYRFWRHELEKATEEELEEQMLCDRLEG